MGLTAQSLEGFNETVGHLEKAAGQFGAGWARGCVGVCVCDQGETGTVSVTLQCQDEVLDASL